MKVYVCEDESGIFKVVTSKYAARDWLASECYEILDEETIDEICEVLNINDMYEADIQDLLDNIDCCLYVRECEMEPVCNCDEQKPAVEQPEKPERTYMRRSCNGKEEGSAGAAYPFSREVLCRRSRPELTPPRFLQVSRHQYSRRRRPVQGGDRLR